MDYGIYHTTFNIQGEPAGVRDHSEQGSQRGSGSPCIRSIIERATYKNLEFIVVENNSTEQETFAYYEKIQKEFPQVKVVRWERSLTIPPSITLRSLREGRVPDAVKQRHRILPRACLRRCWASARKRGRHCGSAPAL